MTPLNPDQILEAAAKATDGWGVGPWPARIYWLSCGFSVEVSELLALLSPQTATQYAQVAKAAQTALAELDKVVAACPVNSPKPIKGACPVCGALRRDTCWPTSRAERDVAIALRNALEAAEC